MQLVSPTNKTFMLRLRAGAQLQTHRGTLAHDDLIGQAWGSEVFSHLGAAFFMLQPSLSELLTDIKRNTQIMYPKDIGYILVTMGIGPGARVIEAGTGSGALTTALSWAVGTEGHVFSYEAREQMQNLAQKNLERLGYLERVTLKLRDIAEGFDEQNVDALFLDVPNPHDYIPQVRAALKPGGHFGSIVPTTNQISALLPALHQNDFRSVDVCELMLRFYKAVPQRIRPTDRMVAHTGYLVFARPMIPAAAQLESEPEATGEAAPDQDGEADEER